MQVHGYLIFPRVVVASPGHQSIASAEPNRYSITRTPRPHPRVSLIMASNTENQMAKAITALALNFPDRQVRIGGPYLHTTSGVLEVRSRFASPFWLAPCCR